MVVMVGLLAVVAMGACVAQVIVVLGILRVLALRSSCSALIAYMEDVLSESTVVGGLVRAGYHDEAVRVLKLAYAACNAQDRVITQLPLVRRDALAEASARAESAWEAWTKLYDEAFVLGLVPGRWEDSAGYWSA